MLVSAQEKTLETIERCCAACSLVFSIGLLCFCFMLPRRKLLAKQVMNLAFADLSLSLFVIFEPSSKETDAANCTLIYHVSSILIYSGLIAQAHIAIANVAMVLRWQGCIKQLNRSVMFVATWVIAAVLAIPLIGNPVGYKFGTCVQGSDQRVAELGVVLGVYVVNATAYLVVITTTCRHSPTSVSGAYVRYSAGYLTGYLVNYTPMLVYLITAEIKLSGNQPSVPSRTFLHIGYIFMFLNGVINFLVFILQSQKKCCSRCTFSVDGVLEPREPRLCGFSVAYLDCADVIDFEESRASTGTLTGSTDAPGSVESAQADLL